MDLVAAGLHQTQLNAFIFVIKHKITHTFYTNRPHIKILCLCLQVIHKHRQLKPGTDAWPAQVFVTSERLSLMIRCVCVYKTKSYTHPLKSKIDHANCKLCLNQISRHHKPTDGAQVAINVKYNTATMQKETLVARISFQVCHSDASMYKAC